MEHSIVCKCGKKNASFNFKNEIMPTEVIEALYCPDCSQGVDVRADTMLSDNGWLIHFDMDVAGLYDNKLPVHDQSSISPETLFDQGYATWRGIYPGDHIDSVKERSELTAMAKENPRKYFEEMKNWAINRMAKLRQEGWRKAYEGEAA
jgi:hypothetical protein